MTDINKARISFGFVLDHEGGYSNDPTDPGGETKYGISKRAHPNLDIKNLTPEQALDIYLKEYWEPIGGDNLPIPYCVAAMDSAINHGVERTKGWMQSAQNDWKQFLMMRKAFLTLIVKRNPADQKYLAGWLHRVDDLYMYCQSLDYGFNNVIDF